MEQMTFLRQDSTNSPLYYPGSKRDSAKLFLKIVPDLENIQTMSSPFLGSGGIELAMAANDVSVFGSDKFEPVINCWTHLLDDPNSLMDIVLENYPMAHERKVNFYEQEYAPEMVDLDGSAVTEEERAAYCLLLSRTSFRGTGLFTRPGEKEQPKVFTDSLIDGIRSFTAPNLFVRHEDYRTALDSGEVVDFIYCDPPYYGTEHYYGKDCVFDHEEFFDLITSIQIPWVVSYRKHPVIDKLYDGYNKFEYDIQGKIGKPTEEKELFIMNY